MTPTNKLRFVERESYTKNGECFITPYTYRILQQWWESTNTINLGWTCEIPVGPSTGEWRDVPIEKENS